jgi:uncharacterized protein YqeY
MKELIKSEMISAMKSRNSNRLNIIRLINGKVNDALKLDENANLISVLDSMIKERNKSIEAFESAGRKDLAESERYEIKIISEFLPKRMTESEIKIVVNDVINELNATSMKDMGKVMGVVKEKLGDKAKPSDIANIVKSSLL